MWLGVGSIALGIRQFSVSILTVVLSYLVCAFPWSDYLTASTFYLTVSTFFICKAEATWTGQRQGYLNWQSDYLASLKTRVGSSKAT